MKEFITKTDYLAFLACPKDTWLKLHKPELLSMFEPSAFDRGLMASGNLVESWAQKLFPSGILVDSNDTIAETQKHIEQKTPVLFQPTFVFDKFLVRSDVLEYDSESGLWNLYEIKGKNSLDENASEIDHVEDANFQAIVLRGQGIKLNKIFIIHLNKEYTRSGDIKAVELFDKEDITEKVKAREESTKIRMESAKEALLQENESALECLCIYSGRSAHCATFPYSHPQVPEYSVHDIARIGSSKKRLERLVNDEIFDLANIPDGFGLTDIQETQVNVHKSKQPIINQVTIREELSKLVYPLYFLDYETYGPAVPMFNGFKPYQHIPFQFSLDTLDSPSVEPKHFEYLHEQGTDPSLTVIGKLKEYIGPKGNIIVYNKTFEQGRNKELATRHPEDKDFLEDLNNRMYDLRDIFAKQHYVHHGFKGKTSIKNVLPVLVPELSYKELDIQEGGTASQAWFDAVHGANTSEQSKVFADLKKYCGLDTYAMFAIWKHLYGL